MQRFNVNTRLDRSDPIYGGYRLSTTIDREGRDQIGSAFEIGSEPDGRMFEYMLEKHFHDIKKFIIGQTQDDLYKASPEYRRMKAKIEKRDQKLDDIADIADPDERL
jgi:hypothetical protein